MIAQLSLPDQDKQIGEVREAATPHMTMEVDWDLGVSGHSDDIIEEDEVHATQACALTVPIASAAIIISCSCNSAETPGHTGCKAVKSADFTGLLSIDTVA